MSSIVLVRYLSQCPSIVLVRYLSQLSSIVLVRYLSQWSSIVLARVRVRVFLNANNITDISWWLALLVEETVVPEESTELPQVTVAVDGFLLEALYLSQSS